MREILIDDYWYFLCVLLLPGRQDRALVPPCDGERMWLVAVWLIVDLSFIGCAGLGWDDEATEVSGLAVTESDDEGEKNLAAIRAILSAQRHRTSQRQEAGERQKRAAADVYWVPPDWLSSYFSPRHSSYRGLDLGKSTVPPTSTLSRRRSTPGDVAVEVPRVNEPPSRESETSTQVPPYTFSAPSGADYPGTIQCAPDLLGGQRCHAE